MSVCLHMSFAAKIDVHRLQAGDEPPRFMAHLAVICSDCGMQMKFLGLPTDTNLEGTFVSTDGYEARLAILPSDRAILIQRELQ